MYHKTDHTGNTYGRLTVISEVPRTRIGENAVNNYYRNAAIFARCQANYDAMEHPDYYDDDDENDDENDGIEPGFDGCMDDGEDD